MIEGQLGKTAVWRRRTVFGVLGGWALVSLARVSKLVEPPDVPPGPEVVPMLEFLKANIPEQDGYLFVDPGEFGTDTGVGIRLRYELFPRRYDDARAAVDESTIHALMVREGLRFVVVPDATQYASDSWLRQSRDWLRRIDFEPNRYLLEVEG